MDYYEPRDTTDLDIDDNIIAQQFPDEFSEIQKCLYDKTVFLTGASGFLGRLILENLLRSCPGIRRIYIHIREKKGKSVDERLEELLEDELFSKVKKIRGDIRSKVSILPGDIALPMCGLSDDSINIIKEQVNFIVHSAACLRMDEPLKSAYHMNVRATIDLLNLAKEIKDLKAFIHVSTAYSHAFRPVISEEFYSTGFDEEQIKFMVENLSDEAMAAITPKLVGQWQNTYAFTKAICESVVSKYGAQFPLGIVRPSIVIGCEKEPLKGWINNVYGATGVSTAACVGLMRVWYGDPDKIADIIPADKVVNATVASLWYTALKYQTSENKSVPIYNLVSAPKAPTTWGEYMDLVSFHPFHDQIPLSATIGEYFFRLEKRQWSYFIQIYLLHLIPGLLMDLILIIKGKKPRLIQGYIKIHKFNMKLGFYCERQWIYQQKNVDDMWDSMSDKDKHIFDFDLTKLDWNLYHKNTIRAIRVYILKDPYDTLEAARKKYLRLRNIRYVLTATLLCYFYYNIHGYLMTLYANYISFLNYIFMIK
ncbi:hypothetical protein O3M35_008388 [Rhynocoris fuscipes]|uniref:Fatty acyl-CoA reductase n=1 Tax=Rhynocoris fuscipes TaxID=488301 RepID=A0AAW1D8F1_9HEMI